MQDSEKAVRGACINNTILLLISSISVLLEGHQLETGYAVGFYYMYSARAAYSETYLPSVWNTPHWQYSAARPSHYCRIAIANAPM